MPLFKHGEEKQGFVRTNGDGGKGGFGGIWQKSPVYPKQQTHLNWL